MIYSIDRIEEGIAVCFDDREEKKSFPVSDLYEGAKEGDCFEWDGSTAFFLLAGTEARREENALLQDALFGDDD